MDNTPPVPAFREALRYWLKLGFISFGGPAGQIAIMHRELVERRRWISEGHFLHALNFCMLLPGPEAQQLATYLGWRLHGARGGIAAGALFVLPSVFILFALSWLYVAVGQCAVARGDFSTVCCRPSSPSWQSRVLRIGTRALKIAGAVGARGASFVAIFFFEVSFVIIIAAAAVIGWLGNRVLRRDNFPAGKGHGGGRKTMKLPPSTLPPRRPHGRARRVRCCCVSRSGGFRSSRWEFGWAGSPRLSSRGSFSARPRW